MLILAYARDEAHRAANALRIKLGQRRTLTSDLDAVPGVGDKTRSRLLKQLGSLRAVRAASETELVAAGATRKQAQAIRMAFDAEQEDARDVGPATEEDAIERAFTD
jgi:excinuclease ABC subunit C